MRKRTQAREHALQMLYQIDLTGENPEEVFGDFWEANPVPPDVRSFTERIVLGTVRNREAIDAVIAKYAENWDLERMAIVDRNILRFGAFELLFAGDIPPKVAINEAVNVAKKYSQIESGKFVNGVLDKISHSEAKRLDGALPSSESVSPN